jgi:hypothetical protein
MVFVALIVLLTMAPALALAEGPQSLITRFRGEIEVLPAGGLVGDWTVAGQVISVTGETLVDESQGAAIVGAQVQVLGINVEGTGTVAVLIHVLSSSERPRIAQIRGTVEELGVTPEGQRYMVVNAQRILLNEQTRYEGSGELVVGVAVQVTVRIQGGEMTALKVQYRQREVRFVPLNGTVESIDEATGDETTDLWTIVDDEGEAKIALVTAETELRGDPGVGDTVRGQARVEEDGTLTAIIIAVWQEPAPVAVHLEGPIQRFPQGALGRWMIAGQYVVVDEETVLSGADPAIGALAVVEGLRYGNGTIKATSIAISETLADLTFEATVRRLPRTAGYTGQWLVEMADGSVRKLQVVRSTVVTGEPAVGATVRITAQPQGRQTWAASQIEVIAAADEPAPPDNPTNPGDDRGPGKPEQPGKPDNPGRR